VIASDKMEIWVQDEARIGQKNKITRRWAKRKRFSDPTLMLARATRQTSRLFGGKVLHI
jgi:hypothetical protein